MIYFVIELGTKILCLHLSLSIRRCKYIYVLYLELWSGWAWQTSFLSCYRNSGEFFFFISRRRHKVLIFIKSLVKLLLTHSKLSGILLFALSVVDFSKIIFFHHFCHDTSFYQQNIFFFHLKIFKKFHGVKFFTISKKVKYNAPFF